MSYEINTTTIQENMRKFLRDDKFKFDLITVEEKADIKKNKNSNKGYLSHFLD